MIRPLPRPEGAHSKDYTRLQMSKIKIQANIVGWGHTAFGKLSGDTIESLIASAAKQAIVHAGIDPRDIDAVWLGHFNSGMVRSEEHTSELQSLMRISYAVFCLKKKTTNN